MQSAGQLFYHSSSVSQPIGQTVFHVVGVSQLNNQLVSQLFSKSVNESFIQSVEQIFCVKSVRQSVNQCVSKSKNHLVN